MTKNKTQYEFIKAHIKRYGKISRNFCLKHYITRLSQYALMLKQEGYAIDGQYIKTRTGKDYVYFLVK